MPSWSGIALRESVLYQVFLPGFVDRDEPNFYLYQLELRIPYLEELGVTTIHLFPIEQYRCGETSGTSNCWRTSP